MSWQSAHCRLQVQGARAAAASDERFCGGQVNAADRAWIVNFRSRLRERRLTREVLRLRQILASTGSIEWAQQSAVAFAEAAKREFDETAFAGVPVGPDLEWLRNCVDFIVQRKA